MSDLEISFPTTESSIEDLRPALDAALQKQFPGGLLKRSWDGDVLRLTGPGAEGSIELTDGALVGRASLKPPASLMKAAITEKISAAMKSAAG